MARFACVCGQVIVTSGSIPNPLEWRSLSDEEFDAYSGLVEVEDLPSDHHHVQVSQERSLMVFFFFFLWDNLDLLSASSSRADDAA